MNRLVDRVQVFVASEQAGSVTLSAMSSFNFLMVAFGLILSIVGAMVMFLDATALAPHLSWIPHAERLLSRPLNTLGMGAGFVVLGIIYRPRAINC